MSRVTLLEAGGLVLGFGASIALTITAFFPQEPIASDDALAFQMIAKPHLLPLQEPAPKQETGKTSQEPPKEESAGRSRRNRARLLENIPEELREEFEVPDFRDREPDENEKLHPENLNDFDPVVSKVRKSIVQILDTDGQVAFGTVVDKEGIILTKLSELPDGSLFCKVGGEKLVAKKVAENDEFDLALLSIPVKDLQPVEWCPTTPEVGSLLVTADEGGHAIATGVLSVAPRPLTDQNRAFLGVEPVTVENGVRIKRLEPRGSALEAGLEVNDIVTKIAGKPVTTNHELANTVRTFRPGDKISVEYIRGDEKLTVEVVLKGLRVGPGAGLQMMDEFGTELSSRISDFGVAFQHDTPLWPEQCGGPIIDLEGRVVGLNIARGGRIRSYAIPADKIEKIIDEMKSSIAGKSDK